MAYAVGDALARQLAVPVRVEHRPGAGGTLALVAPALQASDVPARLTAAGNLVLGVGPGAFAQLMTDDRAMHQRWLAGRR